MPLANPYHDEYVMRFAACLVLPAHLAAVDVLVDKLVRLRPRYDKVGAATATPWWFLAAVHSLEADLSFRSHLHNGDPLTARTTHVPAGRPAVGEPPFTWEQSAIDAITMRKRVDPWDGWTLPDALCRLERYNGLGYRRLRPPMPSPYLWSFSNQYTAGKYVSDGRYDPHAVSHQCGGATIWKRMEQRGIGLTFP